MTPSASAIARGHFEGICGCGWEEGKDQLGKERQETGCGNMNLLLVTDLALLCCLFQFFRSLL